MKVYPTEKIRNIALVGHGGTGKTSMAEAMLYYTGASKRLGKVDDGNSVSDYLPEEVRKKFTIGTAVIPCEYREHKINILDTPGYADFYFEVCGALRVVDSMVVFFSANSGNLEVQSQVIWEENANIPKLAVINKMDRENADYTKTLNNIRETFSEPVVPVQLPIGAEDNFKGVVDLIRMKAYMIEIGSGKSTEAEIPADMMDDVEMYKMELIEAAAEADDELLSKYLEGEELSDQEIVKGIKAAAKNGSAVFVFCGAATKVMGAAQLMDFIVDCSPTPDCNPFVEDKDLKGALQAQVFKTIADPYIGRLSLFRIFAGTMKADSTVYNVNKEKEEKITQLLVMTGKEQSAVPEMQAGDIGAVAKLAVTGTSDTLSVRGSAEGMPPVDFPIPTLSMAIEPKSKGDEDKLSGALNRIMEEDPTIRIEKNPETRQTIITTMGDTHVDIILDKLSRKYGVEVIGKDMRIPYRETIRALVEAEGKHKKQSGGHGQYGHVWVKFEPTEEGNFVFEEKVFGGSVPRNFFPAVEKGLLEAMDEGVLAGYPVANLKATLYDGSYHSVDSSEMAFKMAAKLAFKAGVEKAKPVLLEPIVNVEIVIPDTYMGDIIGDLNSKRGRVLGMEPVGNKQMVKAQVPLAEMARYTIDLKSITQGRGKFKMEVDHYEEVPAQDAEKIIAKAKQEREEKEK